MASSSDVTAGTNATVDQFNNLRKDLVLGQKVVGTDTPTGSGPDTCTFDLSDKTKGNVRSVTLDAATTFAVSNDVTGQVFSIDIIQGGTGSYTVTWWSGITWLTGDGLAPTLPTAVGKIMSVSFIKTGTGAYRGFINGFNS